MSEEAQKLLLPKNMPQINNGPLSPPTIPIQAKDRESPSRASAQLHSPNAPKRGSSFNVANVNSTGNSTASLIVTPKPVHKTSSSRQSPLRSPEIPANATDLIQLNGNSVGQEKSCVPPTPAHAAALARRQKTGSIISSGERRLSKQSEQLIPESDAALALKTHPTGAETEKLLQSITDAQNDSELAVYAV